MEKFSWPQMRQYWETRVARLGATPEAEDPDALRNVCTSDFPLWLNDYFARGQRRTYKHLLSMVPKGAESHALDLGCGSGRWCRLLTKNDYAATGIDLQCDLIERNKQRYPLVRFFCTPIQDYQADRQYDLVSTVTVIQHLPLEEQRIVAKKIETFVTPGGYLLMLENIHDQGRHVFARSIAGWQDLLGQQGFELVALKRYDYNMCTRSYRYMVHALMQVVRFVASRGQSRRTPDAISATAPGGGRSSGTLLPGFEKLMYFVMRVPVAVDSIIDPILWRNNAAIPSVHCGFLFRAGPIPTQ